MEDLNLVTVATFTLRHEAEIARARLAADGIPALVQADDEGGLNPGFFAEYGVRLVVRQEQRADAAVVLELVADGIEVNLDHVAAMVADAVFAAPEEACGLLAFDRPDVLRFVYSLTNADRSAHRFTIDPSDQFGALNHAERQGWEIAGVFHSHPLGDSQPSITDLAAEVPDWWVHLIVGLSNPDSPQIKAFVYRSGEAVELSITVR